MDHVLERVKRIELSRPAWKAGALPLSYTRILEQKTRFELATLALARRCSTTEPLLLILVLFKQKYPRQCCFTEMKHIQLRLVRYETYLLYAPVFVNKH